MAALFACASLLLAQSTPASITTIALPVPTSGQAVFDSAGNQYYMQGPVTPGSAQPQAANGTCYAPTGLIGPIPVPCTAAQIVKLDPTGKVLFGTYLGGQTADSGTALAIDPSGSALITGSTGGQFPTTSGAAIVSSTTATTFAARLSADGSRFVYVTYLPATIASTTAIAIDSKDNAYITGTTASGAAVVIALSADGSTILYNVTLGPGSTSSVGSTPSAPISSGTAITIDSSGNSMVAGWTSSPNFSITSGALQSTLNGAQNLFLAKLDPSGNVLVSTYLGGSGSDSPTVLQTDSSGNIYLAGYTTSANFPTTPGTFEPTAIVPLWNNFGPGGFAAKLSSSASQLIWSTYVMSADIGPQAGVTQMAVTASGDVYVAGNTGAGFPTTPSAPEACFGGFDDAGFVAHLTSLGALADATYLYSAQPPLYEYDTMLGLAATGNSIQAVWSNGTTQLSTVQFGGPGWVEPSCLSSSVLNAATMSPGNVGIAAGELVTLTGFGIGPEDGVSYTPGPQGEVPTETGGVQVLFNGAPAPVLYASSRQINAIAPAQLASQGTASVTVTYGSQQFAFITVPLLFGSPGIFRLYPGSSTQAAAINQDGTINGPSNPAEAGSIVSLWTTGYGPTSPACSSGGLNVPAASGLAPGTTAQLFRAGNETNAVYAGSAPGLLCGIVQLNMQVPQLAPGNYVFMPWVTQILGNTTTQYQPSIGATIWVK